MLENAEIFRDDDGNLWLNVHSFKGVTMVNLSLFIKDEELMTGLDAWAREQLGEPEDED